MRVEDRVDAIENASARIPMTPKRPRRRKESTPSATNTDIAIKDLTKSWRGDVSGNLTMPLDGCASGQEFPERNLSGDRCGAHSWTVHISLMPTSSQTFPFEKDTVAYKRCLSRGLHQKVVVSSTNGDSFKEAVNCAFAPVLQGRPWQPLVAKICDIGNSRGLPMLQKLATQLIGTDYDAEFLKKHCAVLDGCGGIEDLYIAMLEYTITWAELHKLEPFLPGLESAWSHNICLDGPRSGTLSQALEGELSEATAPEKISASDMLSPLPAIGSSPSSTTLKRNISRISRTPSFGSTTEGEDSRTKLRQLCIGAGADLVGRCAEIG
ncbi:hypothetical protein DSL72_007655 [Monilinia vaccinii-corymbosi]|uniref:Uncharacterized protein n=1 Tax=Monilinia vaccinii-corymbosi TaxID=61207 RepID=A0A8A3PHJ7_9HELO|nr:hypothetical protein DSL72_007655 [Monilinia vaccinii-corymbosi]